QIKEDGGVSGRRIQHEHKASEEGSSDDSS
ncbi:hypothetical protein BMETH_3467192836, partial [methanotrophic bacterial endosymbiont of Bathymodiolus sp.]